MIYLFVWEKYFRKKLINSWKEAFKNKYSENNIIHIQNYLEYDLSFYNQNLLSTWFFSTKNLFIIDDAPISVWEENDQILKFQEFLIKILPKIISENVVVFNNLKADKRSKLYKAILEIWEIKDFIIKDENDLKQKIKETYKDNISLQAINKLVELKWINFASISNELDKLFITRDFVDLSDLKEISHDLEESIFDIINDILALNIKSSILKLRDLDSFLDNFYLLYNSLVSNLRVYFYIFKLKSLGHKSSEIKEILDLWNRGFLVDRNYKIDKIKFEKIYKKLIFIDSRMKTWKLIWSDKNDLIYELERALMS